MSRNPLSGKNLRVCWWLLLSSLQLHSLKKTIRLISFYLFVGRRPHFIPGEWGVRFFNFNHRIVRIARRNRIDSTLFWIRPAYTREYFDITNNKRQCFHYSFRNLSYWLSITHVIQTFASSGSPFVLLTPRAKPLEHESYYFLPQMQFLWFRLICVGLLLLSYSSSFSVIWIKCRYISLSYLPLFIFQVFSLVQQKQKN